MSEENPNQQGSDPQKPATSDLSMSAGSEYSVEDILKAGRDKHRKQYNDMEWAREQPEGEPKYKIGDVVEFHAGGFGVIDEVNIGSGGWPSSYSTSSAEWMNGHPRGKVAWHYEGDFKNWIAKSPLHSIKNDKD